MPARSPSSPPVVAIVGATGAVGVELIRCLEERRFPLAQLRLFASARSAGKTLPFRGEALPVRELTESSFAGVDIALFSAGGSTSKRFAPLAVRAGATVIDNSSAFRMDPQVPLVVPEINPRAISRARRHHRQPQLLRDHFHHAALADTPGEPHHAAAAGDLPGGLGRRRGGDGGAARIHARLPRGRAPTSTRCCRIPTPSTSSATTPASTRPPATTTRRPR